MLNDIENTADLIDVRDIIARVEELEGERDTYLAGFPHNEADVRGQHWSECTDEGAELDGLTTLLASLEGMGGDEQWRGVWYPVTLIRESYFREYVQDLAEDIGAINADATWPNNCIDWDEAAYQLRHDYTRVEIGKFTYYYR